MKLLDWGEDGMATSAETAALRASFRQEVAVWHKLDHPNVTKVQTILLTSLNSFKDLLSVIRVIIVALSIIIVDNKVYSISYNN